jgi:hypothetical protein
MVSLNIFADTVTSPFAYIRCHRVALMLVDMWQPMSLPRDNCVR